MNTSKNGNKYYVKMLIDLSRKILKPEWQRVKKKREVDNMIDKMIEVLFSCHYFIGVIGATLIIVTLIICITVFAVTYMKIKSSERQHNANLNEAKKIKEEFCKSVVEQDCI